MATKWDPLVLKYQRQNQQELGRLTELRRHLKDPYALYRLWPKPLFQIDH